MIHWASSHRHISISNSWELSLASYIPAITTIWILCIDSWTLGWVNWLFWSIHCFLFVILHEALRCTVIFLRISRVLDSWIRGSTRTSSLKLSTPHHKIIWVPSFWGLSTMERLLTTALPANHLSLNSFLSNSIGSTHEHLLGTQMILLILLLHNRDAWCCVLSRSHTHHRQTLFLAENILFNWRGSLHLLPLIEILRSRVERRSQYLILTLITVDWLMCFSQGDVFPLAKQWWSALVTCLINYL